MGHGDQVVWHDDRLSLARWYDSMTYHVTNLDVASSGAVLVQSESISLLRPGDYSGPVTTQAQGLLRA